MVIVNLYGSMRIWHEELIPKLCRQHLLACWREGLGCYAIITEGKKGYRNHPQVKEFEHHVILLAHRLQKIRIEMVKRGYKPKKSPFGDFEINPFSESIDPTYKRWQTLDEQIAILKSKKCECRV